MAACDFCGTPRDQVAFLVASKRGGCRVAICDGCIDDIAATVAIARAMQNAPETPKSGGVDAGNGAAGTCGPETASGAVRASCAISEGVGKLRSATEEELAAQRESWVRGEMAMGTDREEAAERARLRDGCRAEWRAEMAAALKGAGGDDRLRKEASDAV